MLISKLVCDKCGTQASTGDKFCREWGEKGRPSDNKPTVVSATDFQKMLDKLKKPPVETRRCRSCGKIVSNYGHDCSGLGGGFNPYNSIDTRWDTRETTGIDKGFSVT
jgi:ribosomal protein L40E